MICTTCWGLGDNNVTYEFEPCPDCNGSGIIHCCDGHQVQPQAHSPTDAIINLPKSDIPQGSCADAEDNVQQSTKPSQ